MVFWRREERKRTRGLAGIGLLTLALLVSAGCMRGGADEVRVFAAASLTEAFGELETAFEADHPGTDIVLNFASSATLRTQIEDGARAEVFASANLVHMEALIEGKLVDGESVRTFASNRMGYATPLGNPGGIENYEDLNKEGLRLVIALPEVPAGDYALEAIGALDESIGGGYGEAVLGNVASYEDSVRQVLLKVEVGEADAGFIYQSDGGSSDQVNFQTLPDWAQPEIDYVIGMLKTESQAAKAFIAFVFSPEGQAILASWGFEAP